MSLVGVVEINQKTLVRAIEIEKEIEKLEYEFKIAKLNERFQDAEDIKEDIIDLEEELESLGY